MWPVAHRREIPTKYPCCVGSASPLSSSGLEEALYKWSE